MGLFDKSFKEILLTQVVSIIGGLIVGTIFAVFTDKLLMIPGMLILIPGFLEIRGNISGALAARITSGLFLGVVKPDHEKTKLVKGNVLASFALAVVISLALGLLAFGFSYVVFGQFFPKIILMALIGGFIANLIEIPLTIIFTFYFFKRGHDPNNIMGPFVTSTGDITSIVSLIIALVII